MSRVTTSTLRSMKDRGEKITVLTAYDYTMARLLDQTGVEILLVGDSLGMVMLGYDSTIPVTLADILHHTRAVARGTQKAMVLADMPFLSYHTSLEESVRNAGILMQQGGAQAVKLEGGKEIVPVIEKLVISGIPVMGHLGLTPQQVHQMGGYSVQGKSEDTARKIIDDAKAIEAAGVFAVVLECIPYQLAEIVSKELKIPTIGIGAGAGCDGQVLVTHDLLGMYQDLAPKFVKRYGQLGESLKDAVREYISEVKGGVFPAREHSFTMAEDEIKKLY